MNFDLDATHFYATELYGHQPTESLMRVRDQYSDDVKQGRLADDPETEGWLRRQIKAIRITLVTRGVLS